MSVAAALQTSPLRTAAMYRLDIPGDPIFAWSLDRELSWDGRTWVPIKNLVSLGNVTNNVRGSINRLQLSFAAFEGMSEEIFAVAANGSYRGVRAFVYLAVLDDALNLVGDPVLTFSGVMNHIEMTESLEAGKQIEVTLSPRSEELRKETPTYYTHEEQQRLHPGDLFFEPLPAMLAKTIYWGQPNPTTGEQTGRASSTGSSFGGDFSGQSFRA